MQGTRKQMNFNEKRGFMNNSLVHHLPIWHFDKNCMVFSDGSLGGGFKLQGIDISCASVEQVNDFNKNLESLLTSLPEGLSLQVFYRLTPNVSPIIEEHAGLFSPSISTEVQMGQDAQREVFQARMDFFYQNQKNQEYFLPEIYLFIRSQPLKYKHHRLWNSDPLFQSTSRSSYNAHRKSFDRAAKQACAWLNGLGLFPQVLESHEWFHLLFEYFNLSRSEKIGTPKMRDCDNLFAPSLAHQVLLTDVCVYEDTLKCGDYLFQVVTLKDPSRRMHLCFHGQCSHSASLSLLVIPKYYHSPPEV